ncbi:hypothetical protein TorRG33x02_298640 [Trema orientale]|uniref:Uncharacterized protein n=1 Tax=Trema orientale TaxID=63057 RepID=A0A2P5C3Z2_TREOI|nr:hypothetical protein TorRG33x02_298640 [Trema orientale]
MAKSTLLGINVDEEFIHCMAVRLGCEVGSWPTKYLGMPLGGNPQKLDFWKPVVAKVTKRLDRWKEPSSQGVEDLHFSNRCCLLFLLTICQFLKLLAV